MAVSSTDSRLHDAFEWIISSVVNEFGSLSERVNEDVKQRREREAQDRRDRAERVRQIRLQRYVLSPSSSSSRNGSSSTGSGTVTFDLE